MQLHAAFARINVSINAYIFLLFLTSVAATWFVLNCNYHGISIHRGGKKYIQVSRQTSAQLQVEDWTRCESLAEVRLTLSPVQVFWAIKVSGGPPGDRIDRSISPPVSRELMDQSFWNSVCLLLGPFWWTSRWFQNKISGINIFPEFSGKSGIF